jgi:hypothetical protein
MDEAKVIVIVIFIAYQNPSFVADLTKEWVYHRIRAASIR